MFFYLLVLFFVSLMLGFLAHPAYLLLAALALLALLGLAIVGVWGMATGRWGFFGRDPRY